MRSRDRSGYPATETFTLTSGNLRINPASRQRRPKRTPHDAHRPRDSARSIPAVTPANDRFVPIINVDEGVSLGKNFGLMLLTTINFCSIILGSKWPE